MLRWQDSTPSSTTFDLFPTLKLSRWVKWPKFIENLLQKMNEFCQRCSVNLHHHTTLPNVVFAGYHARSRRPMVEDVQIKGGEIHKVVDYSE
eukprot:m.450348 g.450348  ORF g.450348 m.450348 type:complete len:92 (+) comp19978_c0_seq1:1074-1349(+)